MTIEETMIEQAREMVREMLPAVADELVDRVQHQLPGRPAISLYTVAQVADMHPALSKEALCRWVERSTDGLGGSVIRVRSRRYIDLAKFEKWLERRTK